MKCVFVIVAVSIYTLFLFPHNAKGEDEVQVLRGQITEIRQQLDDLRREFEKLRREVASGDSSREKPTAPEKPKTTEKPSSKSDEGELLGVLWELDVLKPDGTIFATTRFFAADGKLYHDSKEVGYYTERGNRVRMDVTRNVGDRAIGVAELLRTSNKPPTYHGRFTNKQGESPKVQLRMLVD